MKKIVLLLGTFIFASILYGQYYTGADWMNDKPYEDLVSRLRCPNQSGNNTNQIGGIRIEVDNSTVRTSSHSNYYAQQRQRKAQQSADRAAFNARRREILKQQALIAAEKKRREDERKFKLYYNDYIAATQAGIDKTKSIAADKATVGRQSVYNDVNNFMSQRFFDPVYVPQPPVTAPTSNLIIPLSDVNENNLLAPKYYGVGSSNPKYCMEEAFNEAKKSRCSHNAKSYNMYEITDDVKDQNMYSKYVTENIFDVKDWWYRNDMSERVANVWDKVKNVTGDFVSDPLGTLNNARESLVDDIKENITLENIAKKSVGLIPDRFENVKNIGNCEVKMVYNVFSKDGAKQTVDAVFSGNMQYVEKKQEYITRQVNNLALETAGIKTGDKITEAALLHNKPKTEQNEWLKNYLTNKATEPSNYVKREATGKIKEIVKKEIDPKGTIF